MSIAKRHSSNSLVSGVAVPPSDRDVGNVVGMTVVLADDHPVVRSGLRAVLEEAGLELVAEAVDAGEVRRKILAYKPDVLVLDLSMPGGSCLRMIPDLLRISPATVIVILTMHDEPALARDALLAGARGFVLKEAADSELVDAILAASGGDGYVDARLGARIAAKPAVGGRSPDGLTSRELEVLRLIAAGYTNTEIGNHMCLAQRTVEAHRGHIQRKLGRASRADLVAYARKHLLFP